MDEGGADTYRAVETSCLLWPSTAQGANVGGVGILWDRCPSAPCGDRYVAHQSAQGSAVGGFAMLLDEGGDDDYRGTDAIDSGFGFQGAGVGTGALIDRGGDDHYRAAAVSQGIASAGLGILADRDGHDTYTLTSLVYTPGGDDYGGFGQGYAALSGLGVLLDRAGDDGYRAIKEPGAESGNWAQGVGWDPGSAGFLLDDGGEDAYEAQVRAQGWGQNAGMGVLRDRGGSDTYTAADLCQGSGARWPGSSLAPATDLPGVGALRDRAGTDAYGCGEAAFDCEDPTVPVARGDGQSWCAGDRGSGKDHP